MVFEWIFWSRIPLKEKSNGGSMEKKEVPLVCAVDAAIDNAGGITALSKLTGISRGHIHRLKNGEYPFPNKKVLKALGLRRDVKYYLTNPND